ncbi:hypothetical protein EMN47_14665 [Prolixibacteraceae bacterium JC049]|nr:hypothetical protein [Prolixibacteraceae bacterium JC049]
MKIAVHTEDNITKLLVPFTKIGPVEYSLLHKQLNNLLKHKIEITFTEAQHLSQEVILLLSDIHEKNDLRIYVFKKKLAHYLARLYFNYQLVATSSNKQHGNVRAIALCGSAGSLSPIIEIVKNLPVTNTSVFIIQHILENEESQLTDILSRHTNYRVVEARSNTIIEPQTIYCARPGHHMIVAEGYIFLTKEPKQNYARPSIEKFIHSAAYEYQEELIAVILSGYGTDGSEAIKVLKNNRCEIIAQDPNDAEIKHLPLSAIKTGEVTHNFTVDQIINHISNRISDKNEAPKSSRVKQFLEDIYQKWGYDYRNYSQESITRRIQLAMSRMNSSSFEQFQSEILSCPNSFEDLFYDFSINVTSFFREPKTLSFIKEEVFDYLSSFPHIKIWCAGCSTGEEAYSLAIMLEEHGLLAKSQIYATDINPVVLQEAENGIYSNKQLSQARKNYYLSNSSGNFDDYFHFYDNFFVVNKFIRNKVLFFRHNLVTDSSINEFQLILLRNVLIYFNPELKTHTFQLLHKSIHRNGFLVIGENENIAAGKDFFRTLSKNQKVFKPIVNRR